MSDGRPATGDRLPGRRSPLLLLALASVLLLAGCGGLGINLGRAEANVGAHTVFLVRDGCATFVARTLGGGFLLAEAAEGAYTPAVGDVLEGPTREGRSIFSVYPPGSETAGAPAAPPSANVPLDVRAIGLPLEDARARLDGACGGPPSGP
jgi:hypothetical protein